MAHREELVALLKCHHGNVTAYGRVLYPLNWDDENGSIIFLVWECVHLHISQISHSNELGFVFDLHHLKGTRTASSV